ncbi:HpcH/HpaI aldolase/citrate lyase family protein [Devosia naphthalenivorans]|uniref:HpcH/HpaI aldolase/citrate lyase family protein n=1 Tax=Devosia naphthalenivorans TaxID=2082392 RepID=UPI000D35AD6E|nr:CoA ester lyase [Devosia naphthalenivorans]
MFQQLPFPFLPLFVPADRPDRYLKAANSGADAVIIDLEDAVVASAKVGAREQLLASAAMLAKCRVPVLVRVNAADTAWYEDDLASLRTLPLSGILLPKAEDPAAVGALASSLSPGTELIAQIESPRGLVMARGIAMAASRLAFGSVDFSVALGIEHRRDALLFARSELVLASALAGRPGPIDGVTTALNDDALTADDACYAAALGFGGKLLIHPRQVKPAAAAFAPTESQEQWAMRVLAASDGEAVAVDGAMVDAPVLQQASMILARASLARRG